MWVVISSSFCLVWCPGEHSQPHVPDPAQDCCSYSLLALPSPPEFWWMWLLSLFFSQRGAVTPSVLKSGWFSKKKKKGLQLHFIESYKHVVVCVGRELKSSSHSSPLPWTRLLQAPPTWSCVEVHPHGTTQVGLSILDKGNMEENSLSLLSLLIFYSSKVQTGAQGGSGWRSCAVLVETPCKSQSLPLAPPPSLAHWSPHICHTQHPHQLWRPLGWSRRRHSPQAAQTAKTRPVPTPTLPSGLGQWPHQTQALKEPEDLQQTGTGLGLTASMPSARAKPPFQGSRVSSSLGWVLAQAGACPSSQGSLAGD